MWAVDPVLAISVSWVGFTLKVNLKVCSTALRCLLLTKGPASFCSISLFVTRAFPEVIQLAMFDDPITCRCYMAQTLEQRERCQEGPLAKTLELTALKACH